MAITVRNFLVCDTVRREVDGKISLVGVYPGNRILLLTKSPPTSLSQLAMYLVVRVDYQVKPAIMEIVSPSGELVFTQKGELQSRVNNIIIVGGDRFPVDSLGSYAFIIRDGSTQEILVSEDFVIEEGPKLKSKSKKAKSKATKKKAKKSKKSKTSKKTKKSGKKKNAARRA